MKYRLCIIFILLVTVLAGCTNTVTVPTPDLTSSPAEATNVSNPVGVADASSPAETANIPNPAGAADVNAADGPGESTPDEVIPKETVPEEAPHTVQNITISAIGDILVHDNCLGYVKNGDKYDFDPPFSEVMPILQSSDLAIGNLETTISGAEAGYGTTSGYNGYPKFNTPDSLLDTLKKTGLDVLITANNHCLDRGTAGLVRTIDQLDERGLLHTGTYKTKEDSQKILVTDVKGIKVAILAYSYATNGQPIKEPCVANLLKLDKMLDDVKKAKELKPDVIIAYLHMGDEYERQPNRQQKNIADRLIKAGVDIILGDHTHVVQPMERKTIIDDAGQKREGVVIYSLGNFISGAEGRYRNLAVILNINIEKDMVTGVTNIKGTQPIPTWVQFYNKDGRNTYRVMTIASAIEKYEKKLDSYITAKDYEYLKGKLVEMVQFVEKGPVE